MRVNANAINSPIIDYSQLNCDPVSAHREPEFRSSAPALLLLRPSPGERAMRLVHRRATAWICSAIVWIFLSPTFAPATAAPVVNGRFESGSLSGWTFFPISSGYAYGGYAAAVDASNGFPPLQGTYSALLVARGSLSYDSCGGATFSEKWAGYCPYPISIPNTAEGGPTLANAPFIGAPRPSVMLAQDITARAGDVLSWEWQRYGEDYDGFFASITDGATSRFLVIRGHSGSGLSYFLETDGVNWAQTYLSDLLPTGSVREDFLTIPSDGVWTVTFGIAQMGDYLVASGFTLDNVLLRNAVPEPSAIALLGFGLAGLALTGRRKR